MDRLADQYALNCLKNFLGYHLGEQHHASIDAQRAKNCSESEKATLLPLVFGLMPLPASFRSSPYIEVKPIIREHLSAIGVTPDPLLVSIIKDLCDNFDRTRFREGPAALRPRKNSIADLRAQPELYKRIRADQGSRCAVCGTSFGIGPTEETLDHVVPWRLGGDPPGGWNWQLLCRRCNSGKETIIATSATPEYFNWIYPDPVGQPSSTGLEINERGRYVLLRNAGQCQKAGCSSEPRNAVLHVVRKRKSGFSVFDHLSVMCEEHSAAEVIIG